jgi:hypothetical protein
VGDGSFPALMNFFSVFCFLSSFDQCHPPTPLIMPLLGFDTSVGWVFDFCNTHWFWVFEKIPDSKNRQSWVFEL